MLVKSERAVRLAGSGYRRVLVWTALTLVLRANAQLTLGDFRGAIATCDDLIHRFGSWKESPFEAAIADALVTRGCSRANLGDDPGAIRGLRRVSKPIWV